MFKEPFENAIENLEIILKYETVDPELKCFVIS